MSQQRRLAAILAADVSEFSSLMGADEDRTLAALQALRRTVDPILSGHGGRIANTAGDSVVAEFPSVAEAVDAAVEIQRSSEVLATGMALRIGINLGDVIVTEDGDVFGDGVNVAARLEGLAPPGGILVSGTVRDSIRGRSPVSFEDLGAQSLRHIAQPVRVFRALLHETPTIAPPTRRYDVPDLLERDSELATIRDAVEGAVAGRGSVVVIIGEPGIGKSALARAAAARAPEAVEVLWGWCDDLVTPRALGPFHDMAASLGPAVVRAIDEGGRPDSVLRAIYQALSDGTPRLVVVEDLHWADDATLDVLTFLARRIQGMSCAVVATLRDVGAARVRAALGEAPPLAVTRLLPSPLSTTAIAGLVGSATEAERLRRLTGGNPYFVSELAGAGTEQVPDSVQDVVLTRLAKMSPEAREVAEAVSVGPTSLEADIIAEVVGDAAEGLREAEEHDMLVLDGDRVRFRHELARQAVEISLHGTERRRLNLAVLSALETRQADPARLVHHAEGAARDDAVAVYALAAADAAAAAGAHREAAAQYRRVLSHEGLLDPETLERVLDAYSIESYLLTGGTEDSIHARTRLLELHRARGDRLREGDDLRWLSRLNWVSGDGSLAREMADKAVEVLGPLGTSRELAMALSTRSQLAMLALDSDEAARWGEQAIEMALAVGDDETRIHALTNLGSAIAYHDVARGIAMLVEARDLAIAADLPEHACRAWVNMAWTLILEREWEAARAELEEAITYAFEHESEALAWYMRSEMAWIGSETGDWDVAMAQAAEVIGSGNRIVIIPALWVSGVIHARRGDMAEAKRVAAEAWTAATATAEAQRTGPVAGLLAEIAWLEGESPDIEALRPIYEELLRVRSHYWAGDLARWLRLAGEAIDPADLAEPYRSEAEGRHLDAASRWHLLGVPYYEAISLYEAGDVDRAVDILEALGAAGTIRRITL